MAGSSASIDLSGESGALPPGSFVLVYEDAWVAQGSYSGIRVTFKTQGQGADHHELTLFIPCHSDFSGSFECSSKETGYNASGKFEVKGGGLGVSKVD